MSDNNEKIIPLQGNREGGEPNWDSYTGDIDIKKIPQKAIEIVILAAASIPHEVYVSSIERLKNGGYLESSGELTDEGRREGLIRLDEITAGI